MKYKLVKTPYINGKQPSCYKLGEKVKYIKSTNETFVTGYIYTIKSVSHHKCSNVNEQLIELVEIQNIHDNTVCHICHRDLRGLYFSSSMFISINKKLNNIKVL